MRELYDVGRVAGLDVGERRIGVAVSDATGTLARPLGVLQTSGLDGDAVDRAVAELGRLSAEETASNRWSLASAATRRIAERDDTSRRGLCRSVAHSHGLPVVLQDERLTSREAESRLALREKDWRARKKQLDAAAAAIILQDYLDEQ